MLIRETIENWEEESYSPYAMLSKNSRGRDREEKQCDIRPVFQRDRDRIIHCKSFRRLKDKTQVFLTPEGDHYRTRLTHTLEVSQNARTIARALRLNSELVEAIALGHDLGHTPFGHAGERALNEVCPYGFSHNKQSKRTVETLEKDGEGLNLTFEVRDGILNHKTSCNPMTLEGKVVRLSDKIAYIHHDMDDAIRGGILGEEDVPKYITDVIGKTCNQRLDRFIHDIVMNSLDRDDIRMSEEVGAAMGELRQFMFERVYTNPTAKGEEKKAESMMKFLYDHYMSDVSRLPEMYIRLIERGEKTEVVVCDFLSSMTDRYAITCYETIFVPKPWIL